MTKLTETAQAPTSRGERLNIQRATSSVVFSFFTYSLQSVAYHLSRVARTAADPVINDMDSTSSRRVDRVDLACVQCRSRHVKCDATQPVCNRCSRDGKDCTYQKSRRGGLDKAALARRRLRLQQEAEAARTKQPDPNVGYNSPPRSSSESSPMDGLSNSCSGMNAPSVAEMEVPESSDMTFHINDDRLLELYFSHFWSPYPVVLPLHFFQVRRSMPNHGMTELLAVLQYIGSLYAPWASSESYYKTALAALSAPHMPRSPFNVQALMLFAIAQYHQCLKAESRVSMDLANGIALELRMYEKAFARAYGEGNPVLEECWRRTWYNLHVNDQHLSVVENTPMYMLANIPGTVDLPCDDEYFKAGVSCTYDVRSLALADRPRTYPRQRLGRSMRTGSLLMWRSSTLRWCTCTTSVGSSCAVGTITRVNRVVT
jgi:hypothetical protein